MGYQPQGPSRGVGTTEVSRRTDNSGKASLGTDCRTSAGAQPDLKVVSCSRQAAAWHFLQLMPNRLQTSRGAWKTCRGSPVRDYTARTRSASAPAPRRLTHPLQLKLHKPSGSTERLPVHSRHLRPVSLSHCASTKSRCIGAQSGPRRLQSGGCPGLPSQHTRLTQMQHPCHLKRTWRQYCTAWELGQGQLCVSGQAAEAAASRADKAVDAHVALRRPPTCMNGRTCMQPLAGFLGTLGFLASIGTFSTHLILCATKQQPTAGEEHACAPHSACRRAPGMQHQPAEHQCRLAAGLAVLAGP